ncbi:thromboxane A2 receptor isoform X1 [Hermetia illucens]|uniref:thromboxane A2 receptor isoform X1 n=1 Tax=Hermetia illucens TaxID=343691 RepID=UPI0018CC4758|nr:thromboxane A2 receptor isoform X1 [Hermetia illucens]
MKMEEASNLISPSVNPTSPNYSLITDIPTSVSDVRAVKYGPEGVANGAIAHSVSAAFFIVLLFYVIGVFGNFLALIILARKKNTKNSKYTLMLRCLASNNLIALLGMLTQMIAEVSLPGHVLVKCYRIFCIGRVICRYFGLSSGCIAAVMAAERWMALARPFTYHKHITYSVIKKTIAYLVNIAAVVTFLPLVGFGLYHDPEKRKCVRYRSATEPADIAYAYFFMAFGTFLCILIVVCNLFVTQVLCIIGRNKTRRSIQYDFVNRDKGSATLVHQTSFPNTSSDEIRFAKLMTFLSISFVVCWMPQMISIPLTLKPNPLRANHPFFKIADMLMALHFTSDPYVYVLSRTKQSGIFDCFKKCRRRGMHRSQSVQSSKLRPTLDQTVEYGFNT